MIVNRKLRATMDEIDRTLLTPRVEKRRAYSLARLKTLAEKEARRHRARHVSHSLVVSHLGASLSVSWMLRDFSFRTSEVPL